jgi:hypothetical protein
LDVERTLTEQATIGEPGPDVRLYFARAHVPVNVPDGQGGVRVYEPGESIPVFAGDQFEATLRVRTFPLVPIDGSISVSEPQYGIEPSHLVPTLECD